MKFNTATVSTGARASQGKRPQPVAAALLAGVFLLSMPMEVRALGEAVFDETVNISVGKVQTAIEDIGKEIIKLYRLIDEETNQVYLANIGAELAALNGQMTTLIATNTVTPELKWAINAAIGPALVAVGSMASLSVGAPLLPTELEANVLLPINIARSKVNYDEKLPLGPHPVGCVSEPSALGARLFTACENLKLLKSYRLQHTNRYQAAAGVIAEATTAVASLAFVDYKPITTAADVQMKNLGMSILATLGQTAAALYKGQHEYLESRIAIQEEVRQGLAKLKSGTKRPFNWTSFLGSLSASQLLKSVID